MKDKRCNEACDCSQGFAHEDSVKAGLDKTSYVALQVSVSTRIPERQLDHFGVQPSRSGAADIWVKFTL